MKYIFFISLLFFINGCNNEERLQENLRKDERSVQEMHRDLDRYNEEQTYSEKMMEENEQQFLIQNEKENKEFLSRLKQSDDERIVKDGSKLKAIYGLQNDINRGLYGCPKGGIHDDIHVLSKDYLGYNERSNMHTVDVKFKCSKCGAVYRKEIREF